MEYFRSYEQKSLVFSDINDVVTGAILPQNRDNNNNNKDRYAIK